MKVSFFIKTYLMKRLKEIEIADIEFFTLRKQKYIWKIIKCLKSAQLEQIMLLLSLLYIYQLLDSLDGIYIN